MTRAPTMTNSTTTKQMAFSEERYRRLFETAHDGILILDAGSGQILDANPFLLTLLEYKEEELLGKQPWEIGIFADEDANKAALKELQEKGYIRYEDLPLQTKNRQEQIDVEFVINVHPPLIVLAAFDRAKTGIESDLECRGVTASRLVANHDLHC